MESAAASTQQDPSRIRGAFVAQAEQLLSSFVEVFPECPDTDSCLQLFKVLCKGDAEKEDKLIRNWQAVMHPVSEDVRNRNIEPVLVAVSEIHALKSIHISEKWRDSGFSDDSKENVWKYIVALNTYAELYCAIPSNVLGKLESMAGDIGERLASGNLDLSTLDINKLGEDIVKGMSEKDLQEFTDSAEHICKVLGGLAKDLPTEAGGVDIENIMKMVGGANGPQGAPDFQALLQSLNGGEGKPPNISAMLQTLGVRSQSTVQGRQILDAETETGKKGKSRKKKGKQAK